MKLARKRMKEQRKNVTKEAEMQTSRSFPDKRPFQATWERCGRCSLLAIVDDGFDLMERMRMPLTRPFVLKL